jgi:hypothetical protein
MPYGRVPGSHGKGEIYGCIYHPLPLGRHPLLHNIEAFPNTTPGPVGTNADLAAMVAEAGSAVSEADKNELRLLQEVYGVIRKDGKAYSYQDKKGVWHDDVDAYVEDRNKFFGSANAYKDYKQKALEELEADNGKLRNVIEPNKKTRKLKGNWNEAQTIFYCWVRKSYQNKLGDTVNIPKLIKSGMSEKLQKALKQVRVDHGKHFQSGGFNPRPMKLAGKYRLGTLSDHALGTAIDVESEKNAQIEAAIWGDILKFTAKSLTHATRTSKWKSTPEELYRAVKEINDEFVKKLDQAIKGAATKTMAKPADGKAVSVKAESLETAIDQDEELKKIHRKNKKFLKRWKDGFFSIEWTLLKELHEEGFTWGATFSDPDLHHFEL